jgi:catechol 2,3-dioxygenase-like lactoylglutathione lyase family enzyme
MDTPIVAIGIELVVADLDRAIELFVDVLGCKLLARGPATLLPGESASIDAGNIVISLLAPATSGESTVLALRRPRLSQLVFATDSTGVDETKHRSSDAGLPVVTGPGRFHIPPEAVEGALGERIAIVVTAVIEEREGEGEAVSAAPT